MLCCCSCQRTVEATLLAASKWPLHGPQIHPYSVHCVVRMDTNNTCGSIGGAGRCF